MKRDYLSQLTDNELKELYWLVYWENGTMLNRQWFNWIESQGITKRMFDLMTDSDSFSLWDVDGEIKARAIQL